MLLEFGDILTLENEKKYLVASSCTYEQSTYIYLVNIENNTECILAKLEDDNLEEVTDLEQFQKIIPLILDNADEKILNGDFSNE